LNAVKTENAFIIGGASLYESTLGQAKKIFLTHVEGNYEGDAYYPLRSLAQVKNAGFREVKKAKSETDSRLTFYEFERR